MDNLPGLFYQFIGQRLDIIAAAKRIDDLGYSGFFLQHDLRVAGDPGGKVGRQRDRFIQSVGVQRLGSAQGCCHCLNGRADNIIVRILLGQRHSGGLTMGAQRLRTFGLRTELDHHPIPEGPRRAQFRHFHEEVHADAKEEAQPSRKRINVQTRFHRLLGIFTAVGNRERQFLDRCRPGFVHMITADRNAVELRHMLRRVSNNIGNDPHARCRRVDIGIADHELLQNVILNRAGQLVLRNALLFCRNDIESKTGNDRPVHRHRHRHFVERNLVEQDFHILDAVDRDTRLADIPDHAWMIAVITAMRREIEGNRKPLLPRRQIAAIEGVGFFGRRKTGILADRPWPSGIHAGLHAARKWSKAGQSGINPLFADILRRVERFYINALRGLPRQVPAFDFLVSQFLPILDRRFIGHICPV